MTFRTNPEDAVVYQVKEPIAGVRPIFLLPDQEMYDYFSSCEGGLPEAPLIEWAIGLMKSPKAALIDVGSHIGTWSITFGLAGFDVWAYDAQTWLTRLHNASVALNAFPDGRPASHPWAIGSESGTVTVRVPHEGGGGGSVVRTFDESIFEEEVLQYTIDFMASSVTPVGLIKIDTEGAELDVLRGATETIKKWEPAVIFECWQDEIGQRREELFRYINDDMDYDVTDVSWPDTYLATPRD